MPIAAFETLHDGTRVAYEDAANPRREGRIVGQVDGEYRVRWDDSEDDESDTISDLRQHGWYQLADLPGNIFDGADILAAYTRERALADGELADASEMGQEAGYKVPVAITRPLWNLIDATDEEKAAGQSTNGRLWDVLWMSRVYGARQSDSSRVFFPTSFYRLGRGKPGGQKTYRLCVDIGPGDDGEPVITIGFPDDF